MVFVEASHEDFFSTFDISLKAPIIIENNLPVHLTIKTRDIESYSLPPGAKDKKKVLNYAASDSVTTLEPHCAQALFCFNLDAALQLSFSLNTPEFHTITIGKADLKRTEIPLELPKKGCATLQLKLAMTTTDLTDHQLSFSCQGLLLDYTGLADLRFFKCVNKRIEPLAWQ